MLTRTLSQSAVVKLSVKGKDLFINSAKVVKADIKASNGIIHVIDGVLIPNVMKDAKKKTKSTNTEHFLNPKSKNERILI